MVPVKWIEGDAMAVHDHRGQPFAYTFWRTGVLTPRWFDDNDFTLYASHPHIAHPLFMVRAYMRAAGLIRLGPWLK